MGMRRKKIDFEVVFNEFIQDIRSIFTLHNWNRIQGMKLYESVYAMCNTYPKPMHEELFLRIADFLDNHTSAIAQQIKDDPNSLHRYALEWEHFQYAVKSTNTTCDYLNKVLCDPFRDIKLSPGLRITTEQDHLIKDSPYQKQKVDQLALSLWRSNVFDFLKTNLIPLVMDVLRLDREDQTNGSEFDHTSCKTLAMSLVILCSHEENMMLLYLTEYESVFLSETRKYYQQESQRYASELSVTEFMKMADVRLNQEKTRARRYLHPTSVEKIVFDFSMIYIANHSTKIQQSFHEMLLGEKMEDCILAYQLLSMIPEGVHLLTSIYEKFVVNEGKRFLSQDPKQLVDELGAFQQARSNEIATWFKMDSSFIASLDKAFRSLVNGSETKFPELLTRYCDWLLKKTTKLSEHTIDRQLGVVILLFNYIDDKDVFQKYYSRHLAKRLIQRSSVRDEMEYLMLAKLKVACGVEYTSKLQRMFTDVSLSHELSSAFQESGARASAPDFYPLILTAGAWPVSQIHAPQALALPTDIEENIAGFTEFYHKKHSGRKLTWLWHLCRVDVRLHGFDKRYEINMGLYHYILLSTFNERESAPLSELAQMLSLPPGECAKLVQSFVDLQLLETTTTCGSSQNAAAPLATETRVNGTFTSKRTKLKISLAASAYEPSAEDTEKSLVEDRRLFLQATIVRLMKARKELSHTELMGHVMQHAQSRFHPTMSMIKKCVEQLIEKQYLERAGKDHQFYIYIA